MSLGLTCPVEGCSATCEGETEDEVMELAEEHAADKHPDLELDKDTVREIKANIKEV